MLEAYQPSGRYPEHRNGLRQAQNSTESCHGPLSSFHAEQGLAEQHAHKCYGNCLQSRDNASGKEARGKQLNRAPIGRPCLNMGLLLGKTKVIVGMYCTYA